MGSYSLRFSLLHKLEYYQEAKQLACYAGTAPFEHSSGTSVRGKQE
ncbi:MAG: transposase [Bacteroidetes bacterium]|nr:transposase [Bacteroidota bacterium]